MDKQRINVLVYVGRGTSKESIRHCIWTLRRLLSPSYVVIPVDVEILQNEPWTTTCALVVVPGGADQHYCTSLNGVGNRRLQSYVRQGGSYLGFCAGGYYGSSRCEFEAANQKMAVVGNRELAFFPGVCRGLVFPGFDYRSEAGARAARLNVLPGASSGEVHGPEYFHSYYNGGGVFVDAETYRDQGVEVLATYSDQPSVDCGKIAAAVVNCKIGEGKVILTGPHIEFAARNLRPHGDIPGYDAMISTLAADDDQRTAFLKTCLKKLGLRLPDSEETVPCFTSLHLSSYPPSQISHLVQSWEELITDKEPGNEGLIVGDIDAFLLSQPDQRHALGGPQGVATQSRTSTAENKVRVSLEGKPADDLPLQDQGYYWPLITHETALPPSSQTVSFSHESYFQYLSELNGNGTKKYPAFGSYLLYGEVVTSTNDILHKNAGFLRKLPSGFTFCATTQTAGRGRGSNVWLSPRGSLMFSTVIHHPMGYGEQGTPVFLQYAVGLAIVRAITSYGQGYGAFPVKLKWPNDVYILDDTSPAGNAKNKHSKHELQNEVDASIAVDPLAGYVKIGGILVNSTFSGGDCTFVVGVGLNVSNAGPTTSLNQILAKQMPTVAPFQIERLLAVILTHFGDVYRHFSIHGWDAQLENEYYSYWLHSGQIITSTDADGAILARVTGITRDWGLLTAQEVGRDGAATGRKFTFQSNGNSFDFFKGLIKRKL